jgi:protein-tyrosine phosphatase
MPRHLAEPVTAAGSAPVDAAPLASARVLVVCTGNICRSPAAERLLAARLGDRVQVASAGVHAVVGSSMTSAMARLVTGAGADAHGFVARQLTAEQVREADLVLTMTRAHRTAVVELAPAGVRRTFTLRELARLADAAVAADASPASPAAPWPPDLAARVRALPGRASLQRGREPVAAQDDDIEDPYNRGDAAYQRAFGEIQDAVRRVVDALARPTP